MLIGISCSESPSRGLAAASVLEKTRRESSLSENYGLSLEVTTVFSFV